MIIHLRSQSGNQSQYDEAQLRTMWQQGLLQAGSYYWKEGMPEWRPIAELFEGSSISTPPPTPAYTQTSGYAYTKDPKALTTFLLIMLWVTFGMEIISALSNLAEMALLDGNFTEAEASANDARQVFVGSLYLIVFIVTAVPFLMWIYRANLNCRGFGAQGMKFTPGWSVGYYFIPIINLYRPLQAMKEIGQVSQNPTNWQSEKISPLFGWWWALWLVAWILGHMVWRLTMNARSIEDFQTVSGLSVLGNLNGIALCLVAITMIKSIAAKQDKLVTGL